MRALFVMLAIVALLVSCGGGNDSSTTTHPRQSAKLVSGAGVIEPTEYFFQKSRSFYKITVIDSVFTVSDPNGIEPPQMIQGAAILRFADTSISINDSAGITGQAYRLYKAAFNRTPDLAGLGYWIDALRQGMPLSSISDFFISSDEFKNKYGVSLSNPALVRQFYVNVLGREPDAAGQNYWLDLLDRGVISPSFVLSSFSESAENKNTTSTEITLGVEYIQPAPLSTDYPRAQVAGFFCNIPTVHELNSLECTVRGSYLVRPATSLSPPFSQVDMLAVSGLDPSSTVCRVYRPESFEDPNELKFRCTIGTTTPVIVKLIDPYFVTWEPIHNIVSGSEVTFTVFAARNPKRKVTGIECSNGTFANGVTSAIKGGDEVECKLSGIYLDDAYLLSDVFRSLTGAEFAPLYSLTSSTKTFKGKVANCNDVVAGDTFYFDTGCILHATPTVYDSLQDWLVKPVYTGKIN